MSWDLLELNFKMSIFGTTELPHDAYSTRSTLWGSPISSNDNFIRPTFWGSLLHTAHLLEEPDFAYSNPYLLRPDRSTGAGFAIPENRVATLTLRVITVSVPLP